MTSHFEILQGNNDNKIGATLLQLELNHEWLETANFECVFLQLGVLITTHKHLLSAMDVFESIDKYPQKTFSKVAKTLRNDWASNPIHMNLMEDLIPILVEKELWQGDEALVAECIKRDRVAKNHHYVDLMFEKDPLILIEYIWKRGFSPMDVLRCGIQQKEWLAYAKPRFPKREKWTQQLISRYAN